MEEAKPPGRSLPRIRRARNDGVPATPIRLAELPSHLRRRAMLRSAAIIALSWAVILGAFFLVPIGHESSVRAVLRLGADIALIGGLIAWQIRRISVAELPELRAIEALGIIIVVFLVAFSAIYESLSHENPLMFTERLDQVRSLYFTISVFSTVGFGDITPHSNEARMIVSAQMLLDLALIGAGVRLILNAAKSSFTTAAGATAGEES